MAANNGYGKQGILFGKIVIAIAVFLLLWVYIYHHGHNGAPIN